MTEEEIVARWEIDRPIYEAWASVVRDEICVAIETSISPSKLSEFLKIPTQPRSKEAKSLVDKALFRNKGYSDPYGDITDKVGMRFVVLLTSAIKNIEKIICASETWTWSKDRDYEEERKAKPLEFVYQSVHYVVRATRDTKADGITVPAGTPCEVQVRTLLQHAHSELTHDSIYKPKRAASPAIQRTVAKSMALIEATDDFFERVMCDLELASAPERNALAALKQLYAERVRLDPESQKSNILILDAFPNVLGDDLADRVSALIDAKPYIGDRIRDRAGTQHLFRQPAILIAYLVASSAPATTKQHWPLTPDELRPIYQDLGLSYDDL